MNPLTKAQFLALCARETAGALKPFELEQMLDALNRHPFERSNPVEGFAGQSTLAEIAEGWPN